jgi:hypothetical protein
MIVIASKPGQLGNLLIVFSAFLAYGFENKVRISNPAFHRYRRYFGGTSGKKPLAGALYYFVFFTARVLHQLRIRNRVVCHVYLDWHEKLNLDNDEQGSCLKSGLCFVQGWQFRANHLLKTHEVRIKKFFEPLKKYSFILDDFFHKRFTKEELVIGIHVRRGDYSRFKDGKFYYPVETYKQIIRSIAELFADRSPHFLISSDEKLNYADFENKGIKFTFTSGHELTDMYALARCAYIAGPPSTFSMWASWYGKVPLYMIKDPAEKITPDNFIIQEHF